ncbi:MULTISPECIES: phenazine antibiotic biosynthesis protein [Actinoalloteichus]|uniref:CrmN n=1 Tax=Actinoalloteichus sp. WH1-2216-6 TaxID=1074250 RepID=H8Y6P3_9PSEU|nr:CrmN [Actinoalloteichus sp. WH1-2216-6]
MTTPAPSPLDTPWQTPPDAQDLVREAVEWHFNPKTGSRFWLERARTLDFNPLTDVHTVEDLTLFPNVVDELRHIPVEDMVPQGYASIAGITARPLVGESGGTTGRPKRIYSLPDVLNSSWRWYWSRLREHDMPTGRNWLGVVPMGPHMIGTLTQDAAAEFGGIYFPLDLDPRWAKRCVASGSAEAVKGYVNHLVDQVEWILTTQDIGLIAATPPLLQAICTREHLVDIINERVHTITWSGASMDADTAELMATEVFPEVNIIGIYGSAMIFCGIPQRPGGGRTDPAIFDPPSPFSMFGLIDPETGGSVPYGERGQLVSHHMTRNLFLPNNLERDTAIRHEHGLGYAGDALSEVRPVEEFGSAKVIEGVY